MRIVSLLASATEMIAELGCLQQLVGRSHECDYPPEVRTLPTLSTPQINVDASSAEIDAQIKQLAEAEQRRQAENPALKALSVYAINISMLQELRPDVIFTQTQCEVCAVSERDVRQAIEQLTGLKPRVVSLTPYRLRDVWEDVVRVGSALERPEQAKALVRGYQERLERLETITASLRGEATRPRVAVLEWLDPLMGAGNWTPELINYAGGTPLFGVVGQHTPWLSWTELQSADPDVLVLAPCGFALERIMQDLPLLQQHPTWSSLQAVKRGRVYAIDGNQYLNRSGPRLVDSAEVLGRIIWGEESGLTPEKHAWQKLSA